MLNMINSPHHQVNSYFPNSVPENIKPNEELPHLPLILLYHFEAQRPEPLSAYSGWEKEKSKCSQQRDNKSKTFFLVMRLLWFE